MSEKYFERIGYKGDAEPLLADISNEFQLGTIQDSSVLTVGFEDCNVRIQTNEGQFVIKAFGSFRDNDGINRYVDVMKTAVDGGVQHPRLHTLPSGDVLFQHPSEVRGVVMDFIDGRTYFDTKTVPSDEELAKVIAEAVKIHKLDIDPPVAEDSWAIPNIHDMFKTAEPFMDESGKHLAKRAIDRYSSIDLSKLARCFVHGDIISTNTLLGTDGKIWILDFAVSNTYPKIQELAVISSSLLGSSDNFVPLRDRVEKVRTAYLVAGGTLSNYDDQALLDYTVAAACMEFMGGHKAKFINKEDPEECDHWIQLGEEALKEELNR